MKDYFRQLPKYAGRFLQHVDFFSGLAIGVVFFLIALVLSLDRAVVVTVTAIIILASLLEAGYGVYRQERVRRAERDAAVRIRARPSSMSYETSDRSIRLDARVRLEIWLYVDIATDSISLNVIKIKDEPWCKIWRRGAEETPLIGILLEGQDAFTYRQRFSTSMLMPITEDLRFVLDQELPESFSELRFELVLVTGSPVGRYYAPLDAGLRERGLRRPL